MSQETTAFDAAVYPNPFNGMINLSVSTNNNLDTRIEIVDINGKTVHTETLQTVSGNSVYTINNLDKIPDGMYFIKIVQGVDSKIVKISKVNN
jgi:flagellar hook assembly protein FlgD